MTSTRSPEGSLRGVLIRCLAMSAVLVMSCSGPTDARSPGEAAETGDAPAARATPDIAESPTDASDTPDEPTPDTAPASLRQPPVVESLWEWQVLADSDDGGYAPAAYDGQRLVYGSHRQGNETIMIQQGGTPDELHRTEDPWLLDDFQFGDGVVAVVEHEDDHGDYRVWLYSLERRDRKVVTEWDEKSFRHAIPQISLDHGSLVFNETVSENRSCLRRYDVASEEIEDLRCEEGVHIGWPYVRDGVISYRLSFSDDDHPEGCRTTVTSTPGAGTQEYEVNKCWPYNIAADGQVTVWSELRPGAGWVDHAPVYGAGPDGTVSLGQGELGSQIVCEGRAFWSQTGPAGRQIRSWAPGGPIEVIHELPDERPIVSILRCVDGWITFVRAPAVPDVSEDVVTALVSGAE